MCQVDESEKLSKSSTVDLASLFPSKKVQCLQSLTEREVSLAIRVGGVDGKQERRGRGLSTGMLIGRRGVQVMDVVEVTLSGNQKKSSVKKMEWTVEGAEAAKKESLRGRPMREGDTNVEIAPMEIRTFYITFET